MAKSQTARVKSVAADYPVPQTRDQVVEAIAEIGRLGRERTLIETAMNDEIATRKRAYETEAEPLSDRIKMLSAGVQTWREANRGVLTDGGKTKTAVLPSGKVLWRNTPPSCSVKGEEVVIALLKEKGLSRFVRLKESVSKEAILADPDAVVGVVGIKITQKEEFVIEPFETKLDGGVS